jgi:hypothetical protein
MKRRGFLGAMLVGCAAPAIVRAESIMRIPAKRVYVAPLEPVIVKNTQWQWKPELRLIVPTSLSSKELLVQPLTDFKPLPPLPIMFGRIEELIFATRKDSQSGILVPNNYDREM